jgi:hypothetical protein
MGHPKRLLILSIAISKRLKKWSVENLEVGICQDYLGTIVATFSLSHCQEVWIEATVPLKAKKTW